MLFRSQAVAAFQSILKEQTRAHTPIAWAAAQNNLGTALLRLGERETGTARLEQRRGQNEKREGLGAEGKTR